MPVLMLKMSCRDKIKAQEEERRARGERGQLFPCSLREMLNRDTRSYIPKRERRAIRSLYLLPAERRKCFWREQRMVMVPRESRNDQVSVGLRMVETDIARSGWVEKSLLSAGEDSELKSSP
ncbi:uncharacterized protein ACIB01_007586 [Guaruba guarouba]